MNENTHPTHAEVIPLPRVPAPRSTPLSSSIQGTLALDLEPRFDPPELAGADHHPAADVIAIDLPLRRALERWAGRYVQAAVEIVGGDRPVSQLLRWTSRDVLVDLDRRAQLVARAGRQQVGSARVQPVRPRVVGVRTCFLTRGRVEVSAHVRYGDRSRAVAARFVRARDDRWCCTALEFA